MSTHIFILWHWLHIHILQANLDQSWYNMNINGIIETKLYLSEQRATEIHRTVKRIWTSVRLPSYVVTSHNLRGVTRVAELGQGQG